MVKGAANNNREETDSTLRVLLEAGSETAAIIAPDGTYLELSSEGAAQALDHGSGDLRGRSLFEFIAPEDRVTAGAVRELLRCGEAGCFEWLSVSDSGRRHRLESRLVPLPAQPGQKRRFALFSRDMTPFRAVESSRELLASIVASSVDALIATDCDILVTAWNHGAEVLYEFTAAQVIGKSVDTYLAEESAAEVRRIMSETLAGKGPQRYEARRIRKDGTAIDISVSIFAIDDGTGKLTGTATIERDIGGLKRTEAALLETQAQLRARLEQQRAVARLSQQALAATQLAPVLDEAANLLAATLRVEHSHVLELMPGDILVLRGQFGWDPSQVNRAAIKIDANLQSGHTLARNETIIVEDFSAESRFGPSEYRRRHGIVSGISSVVGGRNKPYGVLSAHSVKPRRFSADDSAFIEAMANTIAQVVERLAGEEVVRRSEEYYRSLVQSSSDAISVIDPGGKTRYANDAGYTMFGYELGNPEVREGRVVVHPEDLTTVRRGMAVVFATGSASYECRVRRKDGTWANVEVHGGRVLGLDGQPVGVFSTRDISERKAAERTILETQAQLGSRLDQQRAVAEFGQRALAAADLNPLLEEAVKLVAATLAVEFSNVMELLPDAKQLVLRAECGTDRAMIGKFVADAGAVSQVGYTLLCGEPVIVDDFEHETRFSSSRERREYGIASGISAPIGGRNRPYGVISAHSRSSRKFTAEDCSFIQSMGNIIAQAVERLAGEQALRSSEQYYRSLIENSTDVVSVLKPDGTILFESGSAARIFGTQPGEGPGATRSG